MGPVVRFIVGYLLLPAVSANLQNRDDFDNEANQLRTEQTTAAAAHVVQASDWAQWSDWSSCSRSCGIGISHRTRECGGGSAAEHSSSSDNSLADLSSKPNTCIGVYKQYSTCNINPCPTSTVEFRRFQCQSFDEKQFHGRRYTWLPYYKGEDKCELLCRPAGYRFFVQLATHVIDGTRCDPNDPYHICIGGQCQLVGCDGVIGSEKRLDRCGVCGGNDSSCHVISGIFTRTRLPNGYNRVTTIPRGACNVNVTELAVSANFLAIRETDGPYIVNGNGDVIGKSGDFVGAGTVFSYLRGEPPGLLEDDRYDSGTQYPDVETILAPGPLNASIDIMALQEQENRGIMYTYTIPASIAAVEKLLIQQQSTPQQQQQLQRHRTRHEHVRGTGRHQSKHYRRTNDTTAITSTTSAVAADQPINDAEDGIQERDPQSQHHQQQQRLHSQSRQFSQQDDDTTTRRTRQNKHSKLSGERNVNKNNYSKKHKNNFYASDDPQAAATTRDPTGSKGTRSRDRDSSVSTADLRPQPGPNFGLPVNQPRYVGSVGSGLLQPQSSYPTAGVWPYTSGQQAMSYQPNPAQYSAPAAGSPYQPIVRTPYIRQAPSQPYYLAPGHAALQDQQGLGAYDFYSGATAAAGGGNHRRRPSHVQHGSQSKDQTLGVGGNGGIAAHRPLGGVGAGNSLQPETSDDDEVSYVWKIAGFTECSQTCGGGFQQTQVVCMKVTGTQVIVTDDNCDESLRPTVRTVTCSNTPCPPSWETTEWSECSTSCDRGQQTRSTECRQKVSQTLSIAVSANRCLHLQRPDTVKTCNDDRPCTRWRIGEWSQCSTECGRGQRTREVVCVNVEDQQIPENKCDSSKPRATEFCDMGSCARTWFYTDWSSACSTECGEGVHERLVHCSADAQRCSEINRPKSEKPCKNDRPCGGQWFSGPWSKCSATCGEGLITRNVVCVKRLGALLALVGDENCAADQKPETEQECDLEPCEPRWYMTEWTECSRTCDTGLRNREVKCLDASQKTSQSCDPTTKPSLRETCNPQPCSSGNQSSSSGSGGSISASGSRRNKQGSVAPCQDKFKNCRVVVQARLCRYGYYKEVCCFSCVSHGYEPAVSSSSTSQTDDSASAAAAAADGAR